MAALDTHIVNVALPSLSRSFRQPLASIQWTVLAYALSLAIWIPASGRIGDRIGTKRSFLAALAFFTIASALCGQARNFPELVAARALQGTGGGMLIPIGTSMLWRAYPPSDRARLARQVIVPVLLGPAIAPVLGGLFVDKLSWRWIFYVNVPVGAAALVCSALYLREHREEQSGRLDLRGLVLSATGLSILLYAISEGAVVGWGSPVIIGSGVLAVATLLAFVKLELTVPDPILKVALLRDRLFRATNIGMALVTCSFLGILYLTPIFLQQARGQSALSSGLTTFVEAIGVLVCSQTVARLYSRIGPRKMATLGLVALGLVTAAIVTVDSRTNLWLVRALLFLAGASSSMAMLAFQTAMFTGIASGDTGHASAIFNAARQTSIALGVAILSTVVASYPTPNYAAFHAAYLVAALIALGGAVASFLLIHDEDARATMLRSPRLLASPVVD